MISIILRGIAENERVVSGEPLESCDARCGGPPNLPRENGEMPMLILRP